MLPPLGGSGLLSSSCIDLGRNNVEQADDIANAADIETLRLMDKTKSLTDELWGAALMQ
jgi:hypothetical protein